MITVLGLGVVAGSVLGWRAWLKHKSEDKKIDAEAKKQLALSEQETKRLEIVTSALRAHICTTACAL